MTRRKVCVVGIDLAGVPKRTTGICCLRGNEVVESRVVHGDDGILQFVERHGPAVVAIDAPLCLPPGRKWTPGAPFPSDNGSHFRQCDLELRARGIRFFPITLGPMRSLTLRGIVLKRALEKSGYRVIEIYPGGAQDIWGIARKQQGLALLRRGLRNLGIRGTHAGMSGDELDAISGAIVGRLFLEGRAEIYGDFASGAIVMPAARKRTALRVKGLTTSRRRPAARGRAPKPRRLAIQKRIIGPRHRPEPGAPTRRQRPSARARSRGRGVPSIARAGRRTKRSGPVGRDSAGVPT